MTNFPEPLQRMEYSTIQICFLYLHSQPSISLTDIPDIKFPRQNVVSNSGQTYDQSNQEMDIKVLDTCLSSSYVWWLPDKCFAKTVYWTEVWHYIKLHSLVSDCLTTTRCPYVCWTGELKRKWGMLIVVSLQPTKVPLFGVPKTHVLVWSYSC